MPAKSSAILCLAVVCLGCSSRFEDDWSRARPPTFPAAGRVEYRGRPVVGALVNFAAELSDAKRPQVVHVHQAVGFTDATGAFRLKTFREGDGAVAGTHRVRIAIPDLTDPLAPSPQQPAEKIPGRYTALETSGLTAEVVAGGPNSFVFTLAD